MPGQSDGFDPTVIPELPIADVSPFFIWLVMSRLPRESKWQIATAFRIPLTPPMTQAPVRADPYHFHSRRQHAARLLTAGCQQQCAMKAERDFPFQNMEMNMNTPCLELVIFKVKDADKARIARRAAQETVKHYEGFISWTAYEISRRGRPVR
ncbi:hypothetical protein [Roseibium salinum]|uniref:Uncharacterized protein n=1 Tax=Roseibium salinum TaxID=1604349 RepID=A0ABT3R1V0_9HYPH|nr:hypothetical protein [Roseibium sp. DSM 29163]MCX2723065.1 hypothetical protein [Roseibium sp. DSM 29163]